MSEIKKIKPSLSKGTRDFLPREVAKRNHIFNTIKKVLRKYGFEEIETPAIEKLETLTGKYGDEGDKLLFKILKSGDYLNDAISYAKLGTYTGREGGFQSLLHHLKEVIDSTIEGDTGNVGNDTTETSKQLVAGFSEKGLRYDLTIPLARYVVMYQDKLSMPFKRFHVGPVWRADRPQKGRYQEFYQCDADVIGSTSLLNEVELTKIYDEVFENLGIPITIRLNNRKLVDEILNFVIDTKVKTEIITLLDKLDKIDWFGTNGIAQQLFALGLSETQIDNLHGDLFVKPYFDITKNVSVQKEINSVLSFFDKSTKVVFDASLMRGLDYYTGTIWEVKANNVQMGSLGGGGRYDNLTEMFGGQNMSGVGISFGIERIYDVMEELNLFPATIMEGVKVLFVPREEAVEEFAFQQAQAVRDAGIGAEIFLGNVKKQKHLKYADDKNIAFIVEVGENEQKSGKFRLRNAKKRETMGEFTFNELLLEVKKT